MKTRTRAQTAGSTTLPTGTDSISKIRQMAHDGAVLVADLRGSPIFGFNTQNGMVPASINKIATSYVALQVLGPDFRFPTWFYLYQKQHLVIKGGGDPLLVSEEWEKIAQELKAKGITSVEDIYLDDSNFGPDLVIPGLNDTTNPYDAFINSLSTNFNTIFVRKVKDHYVSSEPQTPVTPLTIELATKHHIGKNDLRIRLDGGRMMVLRYTGEVCQFFLEKAGIAVKGKLKYGPPAGEAELVYKHLCPKPLSEVIRQMLKFSNNFIANQLFFTTTMQKLSAPATLQSAEKVHNQILCTVPNCKNFVMVEGSGLSRQNQLTAESMAALLQSFYPYRELMNDKKHARIKTGTLCDTKTLCGYFPGPKNEDRIFVILLRGANYKRHDILDELRRAFG